ncbi:MAG TPA: sugar transferase [Tepidisphaeraceae bacterium]|jgi:lipopolysaccharide/colanic/teichoic acid biosynthesis glycosyltransferase|nr:sugar transferase [Tepidisphaeraceae bacterium]
MRSHRFDAVAAPLVMDHLVRRECARADRNGQAFSLVLFRVGHGRRRSMLVRRLARTMLKSVRLTDDVGWMGAEHLAALLPDTMPQGARAFAEKVAGDVARHQPRPLATVYSYPRDRVALMQGQAPAPLKVPELVHVGEEIRAAGAGMKLNGYGHGHSNGKANGKKWMNGHNIAASDRFSGLGIGDHESTSPPVLSPVSPRSKRRNGYAKGKRAANAAAVSHAPVEAIEELLAYPMPRWKRTLDMIGAAVLLMVLSPILAVAAAAIKLTSPGSVIFTQRRSGLGGKPFVIYKFRTMCVNAEKRQQELRAFNEQDGPAFKLTNDPRVTKIGHILRKTSIDELPQLWNVIRGEMSLVGPRPLPIAEQEGCEQWQRHRLNATPGLTCIWQVKGRSTVSFSEWVRMDVEYMRRRTIFHDLTILFSTIPSVILRRGAR